jgi:hypothetical protein
MTATVVKVTKILVCGIIPHVAIHPRARHYDSGSLHSSPQSKIETLW